MRCALLLFAFLMSSSAWAGLYLEPYGGYLVGTDDSSYTASGTSHGGKSNTHGLIYGGKIGFGNMLVTAGGDYLAGSLDGGGTTTTMENIGAFVQVNLPLLLKLSASYYFSGKDKWSSITGSGNGFKVGFGFRMMPFVMLNFDYLSMNYNSLSGGGVTSGSDKISGGIASISIPISL